MNLSKRGNEDFPQISSNMKICQKQSSGCLALSQAWGVCKPASHPWFCSTSPNMARPTGQQGKGSNSIRFISIQQFSRIVFFRGFSRKKLTFVRKQQPTIQTPFQTWMRLRVVTNTAAAAVPPSKLAVQPSPAAPGVGQEMGCGATLLGLCGLT